MKQYIGTFERTIQYKITLAAKNEEDFIKKGIRNVRRGDGEVEEENIEIIDVYENYLDESE